MSSDEKKPDPSQEQEFEKWDREHRKPESEEEIYVLSDAERKFMRDQARFHRTASETLKAFGNKARQKAYAKENAAIEVELDAARGGREKSAATIPERSSEPDPKPADNKPPAAVAQIKKPALTPDPAASKIPEPRIPADEIAETASAGGEASTKKADPEQLLAQRRELNRRLKEGQSLSKREAAIYFGKDEKTIYNWCEAGTLVRVGNRGRITAASIRAIRTEDDLDLPE
jgi:hypothetical protein